MITTAHRPQYDIIVATAAEWAEYQNRLTTKLIAASLSGKSFTPDMLHGLPGQIGGPPVQIVCDSEAAADFALQQLTAGIRVGSLNDVPIDNTLRSR